MTGEVDNIGVEIAFLYTVNQSEIIYSFVNNINTHEVEHMFKVLELL